MKILGIETSCDETGVAIAENGKVIAAMVSTQTEHAKWGGVVPEIASRLHQKTLATMVHNLLKETEISFSDLDGIAATRGPGLIGALLVGVSYAKGLATGLNIPYVGVNHLEGHLWAAEAAGMEIPLPALALLVSGGHTELICIEKFGSYTYLGGTVDDAIGEAFDKVGGLLGISYPAGAELSKIAENADRDAYPLPVSALPGIDFSYSGLKTAVMRLVNSLPEDQKETWRPDVAASFQHAAVSQVEKRLEKALQQTSCKSLILAGGVAANHELRVRAVRIAKEMDVALKVPPVQWCTDNGAMIAYLGAKYLENGIQSPLTEEADPNLSLV